MTLWRKIFTCSQLCRISFDRFAEHSEEVIQLTDERLVEIRTYFKELIMEIEA